LTAERLKKEVNMYHNNNRRSNSNSNFSNNRNNGNRNRGGGGRRKIASFDPSMFIQKATIDEETESTVEQC